MYVEIWNKHVQVVGCSNCGQEEYSFFADARCILEGREEFGRYCPICYAWISCADVREWLEENEPEVLEELRKLVGRE